MNEHERIVRGLLDLYGINYGPNSERVLEEIIGEKIDYQILEVVILRGENDFTRFAENNMPQGYRFGALKIMVANRYANIKSACELLKTKKIVMN